TADALVRRQIGDVLAEEEDPTGGRRKVASDGVEQRGLARAIGAQHGPAFADGDRERNVLDRRERTERAADTPEYEGISRCQRLGGWLQCRHQSHVALPDYGQFGTSRLPRPILAKSAFERPRVCDTSCTTLVTLL